MTNLEQLASATARKCYGATGEDELTILAALRQAVQDHDELLRDMASVLTSWREMHKRHDLLARYEALMKEGK